MRSRRFSGMWSTTALWLATAWCLANLLLTRDIRAQDLAEQEAKVIRAAVERVAPSVVRIETVGGLEQLGDVLLGEGPTTGLVVSSDGFIISSAFNFLRQPSSILVTLPKGQRIPARVVARDHGRKLVLLRVTVNEPLTVPTATPLAEIDVGQTAIAVGRTFHPDKPNVSQGIISAKQRIWGKAVQTDAKVSPGNYGGPLLDLQGRVMGVLVPLSPSSQHELAGAEWYDGGIGFAVPLADIFQRLERMKNGEDLHPGLLGVTLKSGDIYSLSAELAACHPKSPAYQAGLRAGDTIVAVNGVPIERQAQLRHALGPFCAGERVELAADRGGQRRKVTIELVKEVDPYEHPFLGILPKRGTGEEMGAVVRYVFPNSPAAMANVRVGDRIRKLATQEIASSTSLREALAEYSPSQSVELLMVRDGTEQTVTARLASLPNVFPAPTAVTAAGGNATANVTEIKIPEEPNECVAYVPAAYQPESPQGLLIVLPLPGDFQVEEFTRQWAAPAEQYGLIVVAPRARLPNMWMPAETGFLRKVIDHFVTKYSIDRTRVVVYGSGASGAMAYLTAFRLRDVVRGVIAVNAAIPMLVARPPDNDPVERLGIVVVAAEKSDAKARIRQNVELLREMKFPVLFKEIAGEPRELDSDTREEMLRWIDTLDQI